MSLMALTAWDRPKTTGDDDHWLSVTLMGMDVRPRALAMAVLLDSSNSMLGERLSQAQAAIAAVVRELGAEDRIAVWAFASEARLVFEGPGGVDANAPLATVRASGKTRLDLGLAAAEAWLAREPGRPRILVLTDGDPTSAEGRRVDGQTFLDEARRLGRGGVQIITVGIGSAGAYDASLLRSLADLTSGVAIASIGPEALGPHVLACLKTTRAEADEVQISVDGPSLQLMEAWRVEPRVQPLRIDGGSVRLGRSAGLRLLLHLRYRSPLGMGRGPAAIGRLRVGADGFTADVPLTLDHVSATAPERRTLDLEVDRLRARVEIARASELRSSIRDPEEQLRLTRQLRDLAEQAADPRATRRLDVDLARLIAGEAITPDDDVRLVELARSGRPDGESA